MKDSFEFKNEIIKKLESEKKEISILIDEKNRELENNEKKEMIAFKTMMVFMVIFIIFGYLLLFNYLIIISACTCLGGFLGTAVSVIKFGIICSKEIEKRYELSDLLNQYDSITNNLEKVYNDTLKTAIEMDDYSNIDENIISNIPSASFMELYDYLESEEANLESKNDEKVLSKKHLR